MRKNKQYECNDEMSDVTMIVVIVTVKDINQAPSLSNLNLFISF